MHEQQKHLPGSRGTDGHVWNFVRIPVAEPHNCSAKCMCRGNAQGRQVWVKGSVDASCRDTGHGAVAQEPQAAYCPAVAVWDRAHEPILNAVAVDIPSCRNRGRKTFDACRFKLYGVATIHTLHFRKAPGLCLRLGRPQRDVPHPAHAPTSLFARDSNTKEWG